MPYKPIHAWKRKDSLPPRNQDGSRNENKILKGAQLQDEFDAISDAVGNIEQDLGNIEGGTGGVEEAPKDGQTYGRRDASWVRMTSSIGGGASSWPSIPAVIGVLTVLGTVLCSAFFSVSDTAPAASPHHYLRVHSA